MSIQLLDPPKYLEGKEENPKSPITLTISLPQKKKNQRRILLLLVNLISLKYSQASLGSVVFTNKMKSTKYIIFNAKLINFKIFYLNPYSKKSNHS